MTAPGSQPRHPWRLANASGDPADRFTVLAALPDGDPVGLRSADGLAEITLASLAVGHAGDGCKAGGKHGSSKLVARVPDAVIRPWLKPFLTTEDRPASVPESRRRGLAGLGRGPALDPPDKLALAQQP